MNAATHRTVKFTLNFLTPLLNTTSRQHFHKRTAARRSLAWDIRVAIGRGFRPPEPFVRARVTIRRYSIGTPDPDGFAGGLKALLDCLQPASARHPTGLGFILDDAPSCMVPEFAAIRCATRAEQRTEVVITELLGEAP